MHELFYNYIIIGFEKKKIYPKFAKTSLADGHFHYLIKKNKTRKGILTIKSNMKRLPIQTDIDDPLY